MNVKIVGFATLLCAIASAALAAPTLSITPLGVQAGNWVWGVDITPDLVAAGGPTPIALELGFRLTGDPLVNVTNINPTEFDISNPGKAIFGWEIAYPEDNNNPEGIEVKCAACTVVNAASGPHPVTIVSGTTNEIFAAIGSVIFNTPGPKPFLKITALGPGNGGPSSSTIEWLGKYGIGNSQGAISQVIGSGVGTFFFSGTATQAVPEPTSAALVLVGLGAKYAGTAATPTAAKQARLTRQEGPLNKSRINTAFDKCRMAENVLMDRDHRLDALDSQLGYAR